MRRSRKLLWVKNRQSVAESYEETSGVIRTWLVDSRIVIRYFTPPPELLRFDPKAALDLVLAETFRPVQISTKPENVFPAT
jgi:hypothetical protein